jgi:hypothetical protein
MHPSFSYFAMTNKKRICLFPIINVPSQGEANSSLYNLEDLNNVEFFMTKGEANTFHEYVNIVMEEELESNECMFVESGAHQAMVQELGDLIVGDDVF